MFDKKSFDDSSRNRKAFGPFPLENDQGDKQDARTRPTLQELRQTLSFFNRRSSDQSANRDGQEGSFVLYQDPDPKPSDFSKSLKDMDAKTLEQLGHKGKNDILLPPGHFTRIRNITPEEIRSIKADHDKVSKLSPTLIATLKPEAIVGLLNGNDQSGKRYIDGLNKEQAQALLNMLEKDFFVKAFFKNEKDTAALLKTLEKDPAFRDFPKTHSELLENVTQTIAQLKEKYGPVLNETEEKKFRELTQGLMDSVEKDRKNPGLSNFKTWCGPKGENLAELGRLISHPGARPEDIDFANRAIKSISLDQLKRLDKAQIAGLTPPIIDRVDLSTLMSMTADQVGVIDQAQYLAIDKRIKASQSEAEKIPMYPYFKEKLEAASKRLQEENDEKNRTFTDALLDVLKWACPSVAGLGLAYLVRNWLKSQGQKSDTNKPPEPKPRDPVFEKIAGVTMSQEKTRELFVKNVVSTIRDLDLAGSRDAAARVLSWSLNDFAAAAALDRRLKFGMLELTAQFGDVDSPSKGLAKGKVEYKREGTKTTATITFPPDATKSEMAADCYSFLHEIGIDGNAPGSPKRGEVMSDDERRVVREIGQELLRVGPYADFGKDGTDASKVAARLGDSKPSALGRVPNVKVEGDHVTIGPIRFASNKVLKDMSERYEKAIEKMEHDGQGDSKDCKSCKKIKASIDEALAGMESTNSKVRTKAYETANKIMEAHWAKPGSSELALLHSQLKDAAHEGGERGARRGRAALVAMLLRAVLP